MKIETLSAVLHLLNHAHTSPALIEMKKQAGRDGDEDNIQHRQWILEETGGDER